jgi:hypothetical protein
MGDIADVSDVYAASFFMTHPEDGDSIYPWNVSNIAHYHTVQRPKSRMNVNWKSVRDPVSLSRA